MNKGIVAVVILAICVSSADAFVFDIFKGIGDAVGAAVNGAANLAHAAVKGVADVAGTVLHGAAQVTGSVLHGAGHIVHGTLNAAGSIVGGALHLAGHIVGAAASIVGQTVGLAAHIAGNTLGVAVSLTGAVLSGVGHVTGGVLNAAGVVLGSVWPTLHGITPVTYKVEPIKLASFKLQVKEQPSFFKETYVFPKVDLPTASFPHLKFPNFGLPGFPYLKYGLIQNPLSILGLFPKLPRETLKTSFKQQYPSGLRLIMNIDNSNNVNQPIFESIRAVVIGMLSNFPFKRRKYNMRIIISDGRSVSNIDINSSSDVYRAINRLQKLRYSNRKGMSIEDFMQGVTPNLEYSGQGGKLFLFMNPFSIPTDLLRFPGIDSSKAPELLNFDLARNIPDFRYVFSRVLPKFTDTYRDLFIPGKTGFQSLIGGFNGQAGIQLPGIRGFAGLSSVKLPDLKLFASAFNVRFSDCDLSRTTLPNFFNLKYPKSFGSVSFGGGGGGGGSFNVQGGSQARPSGSMITPG